MTKRALAVFIVLGMTLGLGACGGGGGSAASFCSLVKKDASSIKNATTANAISALKSLKGKAPSAIKSDMTTLVDFVSNVSAAHPPTAADSAKALKASTNIEKYVKDQCKVDLTANT